MKKIPVLCRVCLFAFAANLLLFGIKLYIGLRSNSIGVYSDAVNNLFDALSGILSFAFLFAVSRTGDVSAGHILKKGEQLCSLFTAVIICAAGAYFAYSSLERFMYPFPVWYSPLGLTVLIFTAFAKLGMLAFYRFVNKKERSPVIKVMTMDCALDFFITAISVVTLAVSETGGFSFDALAGLVISVMITVPAVKSVISHGSALIDRVPSGKAEAFRKIFARELESGVISDVRFSVFYDETVCYITLSEPADLSEKLESLFDETGIKASVIN